MGFVRGEIIPSHTEPDIIEAGVKSQVHRDSTCGDTFHTQEADSMCGYRCYRHFGDVRPTRNERAPVNAYNTDIYRPVCAKRYPIAVR